MASLTSGDLRQAVVATGEWHAASTPEELETAAISTLRGLIPADGVGWNEIDLVARTSRALTSPSDYLIPSRIAVLNEFVEQHPIVRHVSQTGDTSATKISDFVNARELHRLELYEHFFGPLGIENLLAVVVQAEPVIIGIAFTRGRRDFTERDRDVLNLLRPHLESAFRRIAERAEAQRRFALLERGLEGRSVVALDADGRPAEPSAVLERWFAGTPEPGVYVREDAELVVRRVDGDPPLLLLDERRFAPDPERVRRYGLTAREAQIVVLAARGLTDAQIAAELYLSMRTVAKHLQHAYAKLGVNTRAAAGRLLLSAS